MSSNHNIYRVRKLVFSLILVVLGFIAVEGGLRGLQFLMRRFLRNSQGYYLYREQVLEKIWKSDKIAGDITSSETSIKNELHPYLSYSLKPKQILPTIEINEDGFRGEWIPLSKNEYTIRIILFGGSVAFGIGATSNQHTIAGYMEDLLNFSKTRSGATYEVLNFGIPGYVSRQELILLMLKGIRYDPDIVLFLDGANNLSFVYYDDRYGYPLQFDQIIQKWNESWLDNSLFFRIAKGLFIEKKEMKCIEDIARSNSRELGMDWKMANDLARANNFKAIFLLQPHLGTFEQKELSPIEKLILKDHYRVFDAKVDVSNYNEFLTLLEVEKKKGLKVLNLVNIFDDYKDLIFLDTCHVWDKGNLIIARRIIEFLNLTDLSQEKLLERFNSHLQILPLSEI